MSKKPSGRVLDDQVKEMRSFWRPTTTWHAGTTAGPSAPSRGSSRRRGSTNERLGPAAARAASDASNWNTPSSSTRTHPPP
ncbi:hypothetical protein GUJ93_ZPchr0007g5821 [Zizania palustris]|uniref:Uncharacterized protein n=1 Tax=Zizania palustris TaxID=103762 RepID=A0A8J5VZI8_ZIZPA|nr:hypothetical protein GUJ93_ZPchr0007g5821 [Zizania palustris]